jgi:hypothetical protein
MRFNKFLILLTAFTFLFLIGCGGETETPKNTANTNTTTPANTNTVTNAPESNSPIATTTATPAQTTNDAPTLKPVVMAYYQALKTRNEAALRKVSSKETLADWEKSMKADGEKSLVKYLTDIEPVTDNPFGVRNEIIQGDKAIAEITNDSYPNGIKIIFVKENGEWKMTNESPEFQKK